MQVKEPDYLTRYVRGEHEGVWMALQALGALVRAEPYYSAAREVADTTMRRVRDNCERIVARLQALGFTYGLYPDGSPVPYAPGPVSGPTEASRAHQATVEAAVGPIPLSLGAFWEQVGCVDLIGMYPGWPRMLDPLVVYPPEGCVSELDEMDIIRQTYGFFEASLAPDDFMKDNVSGGSPYGLRLPDPCADFVLNFERHKMLFVPYLRLSILQFGGFPGLEGREAELDVLGSLVEDLEPF